MDNEQYKKLPQMQEENSGIRGSISDWAKQKLEHMSPEKRTEMEARLVELSRSRID